MTRGHSISDYTDGNSGARLSFGLVNMSQPSQPSRLSRLPNVNVSGAYRQMNILRRSDNFVNN